MSQLTGGYYRKSRRAEPGGLADDPKAASRLWQISAELAGTTDVSGR